MNFELKVLGLPEAATEKCDLLVLLVAEGFDAGSDALSAVVARALKAKDFEAQPGKTLELYQLPAVAARRVVLAGVGSGTAKAAHKAVVACAGALKGNGVQQAVVCFAGAAQPDAVAAAVQAVAEATYVYTATKPQAKAPALARVTLAVADRKAAQAAQAAFARGKALAAGVGLAREWANRPANHATPTLLAQAAQALADLPKVQCKVLGPAEVEKLGMGAFMAVARGSHEPLRFIELRYQGGAKSEAPVVLVGKGITFDAGGISLKPAAEMDEMKYDMCGAASVIGTFKAIARMALPINVVGLVPTTENMPGGSATRPGDVVTSMSGQTIEILNTDAEGRLILCDALTYAERFKPACVIDVATLTGACVVALGKIPSGLLANDDELAAELLARANESGDRAWQLPLWEEYQELLKSNFADMGNIGGRYAGTITAACFLARFTKAYKWAHLDIAGTAWVSGDAKGATGRPVPLLAHFLATRAGVTEH